MSLRLRLSLTFAVVALVTGLAVVVAAPTIVGRGFARLEAGAQTPGGGGGQGQGPGQGAGPGGGQGAAQHAQEIQREMTSTIVLVALVAAGAASLLGFVIAGRIAAPLRRLEEVAGAVAAGDLARRSGLEGRPDEIGSLGRSFDAMARDLEVAEASRRRLFQDAAHEMKTPLAVIEATTTAVLDGVYPHDRRHLDTVREQARLLSRIVDDLRTISLAESGHLAMRTGRVELGPLIEDVARSFAARAEPARVALVTEVSPAVAVSGDRDRLVQVLGALLDNALRHAPAGGRITVAAVAAEGRCRVSVTDTGPGIPEEALGRVFDRFFQADDARDRATGTSGLGLSIARALVEAQDGRIGVENAEGGGARFWFELPMA